MTARAVDEVVAVDVGATKIAIGRARLGDARRGRVGRIVEQPLPRLGDAHRELELVSASLREAASSNGGTVVVSLAPSVRNGVVVAWPNRPEWTGFPVVSALGRTLRTDVVPLADGDAAAIADADDVADVCYVSLFFGTGVAGGVVRSGAPLQLGPIPTELGHVPTRRDGPPCVCGGRGCLQASWVERREGRATAADFAEELAAHLVVLSRIFPACVVTLGGRTLTADTAAAEGLLHDVRSRLPQDGWAPEVRMSRAGPHAPLRGALMLGARLAGGRR